MLVIVKVYQYSGYDRVGHLIGNAMISQTNLAYKGVHTGGGLKPPPPPPPDFYVYNE